MDSQSFLFRLARSPANDLPSARASAHQRLNFPDPIYGQQLQDKGVTGLAGEGRPVVTYSEKTVTLANGDTVTLRAPHDAVTALAYGPLDPATTLSPRIAQSLAGMGLLEAIPESEILAEACVRRRRAAASMASQPCARSQDRRDRAGTLRLEGAEPDSAGAGGSGPLNRYRDFITRRTRSLWGLHQGGNGVPENAHRRSARLGDTEAPDPILDLLTAYTANIAPAGAARGG